MRWLNEDIEVKRQNIDIGIIVSQEEISLYESKFFGIIGSGNEQTPLSVKLPLSVYNVKSLLSNVVYRGCLACSELGSAGYKEGDVVIVLSINDILFLVLTKVDWLIQKRIESLESEVRLPNRKFISNEKGAIILEPSGEIVIKFRLGVYDYYARFGGYSNREDKNVFFSLVSSDRGEIFNILLDGSIDIVRASKVELNSNIISLSSDSFMFKALEEGGSIRCLVNDEFSLELENKEGLTKFLVHPSEYIMEFGKNRKFKIVYSSKQIEEGWVFIDLSKGLRVEMDGKESKFTVYSGDFDESKIEPVAKSKTLKEELDDLRNQLNNFIMNVYNMHTHTGNLGFPTSSPLQLGSSLKEFTERWFSKRVDVE